MQLLRYALKNIFRNFFLSVSSILIIGLLVFFVHILLLVIFSTETFIGTINNRISISINLKDGYENTQVRSQEFFSGVTQNFSGVLLEYISRDDALSLLTLRNPDLALLIEKDANPLPNSIRLSNIDIDQYTPLNVYIARFRDILQYDQGSFDKKLLDYRSQYERIASLILVFQRGELAVWVLLGLFVFTVAIVVYIVIHNFVFFLQDEIKIIELVGGKSLFIYGPFIIQGMLYAFIATSLAMLLFLGGIRLIAFQEIFRDFSLFFGNFLSIFYTYFWLLLLSFVLIGGCSAFLASWRYIHTTIAE